MAGRERSTMAGVDVYGRRAAHSGYGAQHHTWSIKSTCGQHNGSQMLIRQLTSCETTTTHVMQPRAQRFLAVNSQPIRVCHLVKYLKIFVLNIFLNMYRYFIFQIHLKHFYIVRSMLKTMQFFLHRIIFQNITNISLKRLNIL